MSDDESMQNAHKLEGRYANYVKVGHNAFEFVIEFGQCYDDDKNAYMHSKIMSSPAYVKEFFRTLQKSLEEYEENYGEIHQNTEIEYDGQ